MKKVLTVLSLFFLIFIIYPLNSSAQVTELLPEFNLTAPENEAIREYLGISVEPGSNFSIGDVKADILLIELFSMYCPYCQEEAPRLNEFHGLALQMQEKGIRIRVLGLGASNSQFEVDYFKDNYEVEFPLFPDQDLSLYKLLQGEGTPGFIGCLIKEGEPVQIVLRESGGFDSPESFLNKLLQHAGY